MTPSPRVEPGLVSVIVPCPAASVRVRRCLAALFRHTRRPFELIAVTASGGGAAGGYLAGVRDASPRRVEVISAPELRGSRTAWQRGLPVARGEFIALVGHGVVVTDAWLDQLVALVTSDPTIGMVGPMSNAAPPPQRVDDISYVDPSDGLDDFAARWRAAHRGRWLTAEVLAGHCLLLKRGVLEASGSRRGLRAGGLRPHRLALRLRRAGFQLAVACDLFVHQDGAKGTSKGVRRQVPGRAEDGGHSEISARRCRVSLTMIVRDEEHNLPACLESAAGLFDEIVVLDTGSTDRTAEIARAHGARVFDFVWVDDFAAARNAALARATGDYAFWLDADDRLEPDQRERLRRLFDGLRPGDAAYVVRCSCDPDPKGGGATVVDHIRLFPIREDVRWTYRVHEQILPALRRVGVDVRWTDAVVRHVGYNEPKLRRRKLERDRLILESEIEDRPGDPFILFNLGSIALEVDDPRAALGLFRRSLAGSAPTDSITRKLYALIARTHQLLGEPEAALAACGAGLAIDADDAELWFRKAVVHRHRGEADRADACWRKILTLGRPERFSSVDEGIYGQLTRRNLGALAEERGDRAEAASQWSSVLAECPGDTEAARALDRLARPSPGGPRIGPRQPAWLIAGSRRRVVPEQGPGDFDPYVPLAAAWVEALAANVVVELGVRLGVSTRALLAGAHAVGGRVWGVDLEDRHGIVDPRFTFLRADAGAVADRWEVIDLLHVDTDPHTEEQTLRWFALYAAKCRAIALHDTHHPDFGVGAATRAFAAASGWDVHEYWGNPSGWTVLTRPGVMDLVGSKIP